MVLSFLISVLRLGCGVPRYVLEGFKWASSVLFPVIDGLGGWLVPPERDFEWLFRAQGIFQPDLGQVIILFWEEKIWMREGQTELGTATVGF